MKHVSKALQIDNWPNALNALLCMIELDVWVITPAYIIQAINVFACTLSRSILYYSAVSKKLIFNNSNKKPAIDVLYMATPCCFR